MLPNRFDSFESSWFRSSTDFWSSTDFRSSTDSKLDCRSRMARRTWRFWFRKRVLLANCREQFRLGTSHTLRCLAARFGNGRSAHSDSDFQKLCDNQNIENIANFEKIDLFRNRTATCWWARDQKSSLLLWAFFFISKNKSKQRAERGPLEPRSGWA